MWDLIVSVPDYCVSFYFAPDYLTAEQTTPNRNRYRLNRVLVLCFRKRNSQKGFIYNFNLVYFTFMESIISFLQISSLRGLISLDIVTWVWALLTFGTLADLYSISSKI